VRETAQIEKGEYVTWKTFWKVVTPCSTSCPRTRRRGSKLSEHNELAEGHPEARDEGLARAGLEGHRATCPRTGPSPCPRSRRPPLCGCCPPRRSPPGSRSSNITCQSLGFRVAHRHVPRVWGSELRTGTCQEFGVQSCAQARAKSLGFRVAHRHVPRVWGSELRTGTCQEFGVQIAQARAKSAQGNSKGGRSDSTTRARDVYRKGRRIKRLVTIQGGK